MVELKVPTFGPPKLLFNTDPKNQKAAVINDGAWNPAEQSSFAQRGVGCTKLNLFYLTKEAGLEQFVKIIRDELARYSLAKGLIDIKPSEKENPPMSPSYDSTLEYKRGISNKMSGGICQSSVIP